jgi:hypothetical protein
MHLVAPAVWPGKPEIVKSPLFELDRVLVRLDHVTSPIVNANHSIM